MMLSRRSLSLFDRRCLTTLSSISLSACRHNNRRVYNNSTILPKHTANDRLDCLYFQNVSMKQFSASFSSTTPPIELEYPGVAKVNVVKKKRVIEHDIDVKQPSSPPKTPVKIDCAGICS